MHVHQRIASAAFILSSWPESTLITDDMTVNAQGSLQLWCCITGNDLTRFHLASLFLSSVSSLTSAWIVHLSSVHPCGITCNTLKPLEWFKTMHFHVLKKYYMSLWHLLSMKATFLFFLWNMFKATVILQSPYPKLPPPLQICCALCFVNTWSCGKYFRVCRIHLLPVPFHLSPVSLGFSPPSSVLFPEHTVFPPFLPPYLLKLYKK